MATLPYVGATPGNPTDGTAFDVTTQGYAGTGAANNATQAQVDAAIIAAFSTYPTKATVDAADGLNATQAQVDAGDAARLQLAKIGAANGIAPLDAGGRVPVSRVSSINSTQRFPQPYTSPVAYNTSLKTSSSTGPFTTNLYTCDIADPMFKIGTASSGTASLPYKLIVFGNAMAQPVSSEGVQVQVCQGSMSGPVIAGGVTSWDTTFVSGLKIAYLSSSGSLNWTNPDWVIPGDQLDVIIAGGGGGGSSGNGFGQFGNGGFAGGTATATYTFDNVGTAANSVKIGQPLTLAIGGGGGGGGAGTYTSNPGYGGGTTSFTYNTNFGALTAGGGGGASGVSVRQAGLGVSDVVFNNNDYSFGGAGSGGGGGGGGVGIGGNGGNGANGGAFLFCHPPNNFPEYQPVRILPTPLNAQGPIVGSTKLWINVQMQSIGALGNVSAATPNLWVMPVPAYASGA